MQEYARELESERDSVKILTMHYSKGLEFPVVFLPDCNNEVKSSFPLEFHENDQLMFSSSPERMQSALAEEEEEKARLLYVAMTRAKQR